MLHPLVYRMRTTPGCFYWIIQILSLQFCYISALKVDSLYSIEKLCCTLQGLKARFYSGALCSQSLVQSFITIKWGSQPPPVIPQRIIYICTFLHRITQTYKRHPASPSKLKHFTSACNFPNHQFQNFRDFKQLFFRKKCRNFSSSSLSLAKACVTILVDIFSMSNF